MSDVLIPAEVSYPGLDRLLDGRYQVNQILAIGDWGRTYLAQDTRRPSQPDCTIQHVVPVIRDAAYQYALRHLFVREAVTLERLGEHGQIPQLLACFEDEQGFHLVQEFVAGDALSLELLAGQPWHEERVVQLLLECLELLAVVHSECCRHGDIRPDTLIRRSQDGQLTLTNFGTVRDVHLSLMTLQGRSAFSRVPNTQGYQAPEQVQGRPCLASDIYAIGIIGIQALTGVPPRQLSHDAVTGEILWQPFSRVAGSTLRHGLVAVLSRMVRADHTQRYPSAKEALQSLRSLNQGSQAQGVPCDRVEASIVAHSSPATPLQDPPSMPPRLNVAEPNIPTERGLSPALQIGIGIGAVMAAAVCGYALPHLLDHSLLGDSDQGLSPIAYWQQRVQSLVQQSTSQAEIAAAQLLRDAYGRAIVKDFAGAIGALKQIPEGTSVYTKAQEKLREYGEKQQIQAISYLQTAYDQAETKAFDKALESLQKISGDTPTYTIAQKKIREYTEKQGIRANALATQDLNPGSYLQEANVGGGEGR